LGANKVAYAQQDPDSTQTEQTVEPTQTTQEGETELAEGEIPMHQTSKESNLLKVDARIYGTSYLVALILGLAFCY
jgi:hypothetical protein